VYNPYFSLFEGTERIAWSGFYAVSRRVFEVIHLIAAGMRFIYIAG
jgi:hypothetical protein